MKRIIDSYICEEGHIWTCSWGLKEHPTPMDRQDCCPACGSTVTYLPSTARTLSIEEYRELIGRELSAHEERLFDKRIPIKHIDHAEPCILWGDGTASYLDKKPSLRIVN